MNSFVGLLALCALVFISGCSAKIYFSETFNEGWEDRWVQAKKSGLGKFEVSSGEFFGDEEAAQGLKTTQDAKFYGISALFEEFSNKDETLVVQFSVKHEQGIDCGGGYAKLFPAGLDQANMNGDSVYNIMFGPDICGSTKRVHTIFNYKNENWLVNRNVNAESDTLTHVYTLIVKPDQTYKIKVDGVVKQSGSLTEDWDFLGPKEIEDPAISKPADWVDAAEIDDPEDFKPAGWDDIPATIVDPEAEMPEDWDEEDDGEWEAPVIKNPEYQGAWKVKRIPNPEYEGEWVHPLIDNPDYVYDDQIYAYESFGAIGFDLWQVKSGTIFDNIVIASSESDAASFLQEYKDNKIAEKAAFDALEQEKTDAVAAAAAEVEIDEDDYEFFDDDEDLHDEL